MAGTKKKKKPAANPARGFATTSIASKPRPEVAPEDAVAAPPSKAQPPGAAPPSTTATTAQDAANNKSAVDAAVEKKELSPEEFENKLEEGELQVLVEKYSTKVKRDSQRQCNRLETEKRLLRGTGDLINCPKWLPEDIMTHLLDLIKAEGRFATTSSSESPGSGKMPSEEDMVIRLWTLQATLAIAEFAELRVQAVVKHILDISPSIAAPGKDLIWGLEEALEWLARECDLKELPPYENKPKPTPKDTPVDTPVSTRASTPKPNGGKGKNGQNGQSGKKGSPKKKLVVTCDSDIEPDNLVPEYLTTKRRLFELERNLIPANSGPDFDKDLAVAKAEARLRRIEEDVLFDKFVGEQEWRKQRVAVEREIGTLKKEQEVKKEQTSDPIDKEAPETSESVSDDDSINSEAQRIASEILAEGGGSDDDDDLGGLFDSLPQNEVDQATGKAQTVVTSSDGQKVIIRDFGKWTGVSPRRVLEEACRSRDPSVRISYNVVSEASFASRQSVGIVWTKLQDTPLSIPGADVEIQADANSFNLTMSGVANPDFKQSEAYAATTALFYLFSGNARDEKVALRLPPAWRDLFSELTEAKKTHLDAQDRNVVRGLRDLVRIRRDQELEDGVIAFRGRNNGRSAPGLSENASQDRARHNGAHADIYRKIWADKSSTPKYRTMIQGRMQLPMWSFRDEVLRTVDQNQVTIVCGETGCGKSTQVPSFLLEHELSQGKPCKIYCTEPRRISAISLAKRVSEELGENRNDIGTSRSLVGYSIRLEANTSRETRLVYATTGIVLRMLEGSTDLGEITHLVLDEVHERTIDSDFLLIALKRLMEKRKDFKVILMSATVDADKFSSYLGGAPVLNVPGRTFPVGVRYLEDALQLTGFKPSETPANKYVDLDDEDAADGEGDGPKSEISKSLSDYPPVVRKSLQQLDEYRIDPDLIVQLIAQIATKEELQPYSKAILVFLPGIAEIRTLNDLLLGNPVFAREWVVYPLHSTIATEDQESAFLVPPPGMRKVVLATNIAETGITIPDVTCVIDTGKHREMRYDERRQLSRLIDTFISRANAKQRRGRAGRVQNGLCFHMFTRYRHDNFMNDSQTPEMLRLSLQDLAIRIKICKIGGIEETLNDALDPPSAKNIRRAVDALIDVRALTAGEDLTPLGQQLARLPLDVFLGKLILLGSVFKCLDMALTVAAILSAKSPFTAPFGQRAQAQNAKMLFRRGDSDLLTVYNAYLAWKRVCQANSGHGQEFQFCRKNFLSQQTLANIEDLKGQLLVALADSGFLMLREDERKALNRLRHSGGGRRRQQQFFEVPHRVNVNSDNDIVSSSVMAWSFYPKLLVRDQPGTRGLRNIGNNQSISLHPSSVNRNQLDLKWLSYYHIMQAKSVYHAHETTAAEPFAVALLCGDVRCDMFSGVITLDGNRGRFALPDWKTMLVVKILRARLREVLTRCFKNPGKLPTAQQEKWLEVWQKLFSQEFTQNQDKTIGAVSKA